MKDKIISYIKNNYKNLLLVLAYIIIASLVYVIWFNSLWHLWYVNVAVVLVIVVSGCVIGYFFIKSENKIKEESIKQENIITTKESEEKIETN